MKRLLLPLLLALAAASCSTSSDDAPRAQGPRRGMPMRGQRAGGGVFDMLPPDGWWREPRIAAAVSVTADQLTALDKLSADQGDEAAKLERDNLVAVRDLHNAVDTGKPSADEILAAANRVKTLRDSLFDRQAQLLVAERTLLSDEQWRALQDALAKEREEEMDRGRGRGGRGGYPGGGGMGRGGRGGRGRFPG